MISKTFQEVPALQDLDIINVTPKEAARMLGVSPETVYREIREGRLPAIKRGRRLTLIRVADLYAWSDGQVKYSGARV